MKIAEKTPHVNTHWRDTWTHNKGKTHQKGMKTHQKGNTIESDLSFMFIGFLTVGEFFHKKKQSAKRREHMSSAQIDVAKRKLDTHENHRRKTPTHENILKSHTNTQQKKKTHFKGMKTHQKGNTIESDLSFIFVGFLTFWISPTNRGKAQRGESTCHLLNGPSNVFDVCSEKKILSTHQRHWGVHRADDMCLSDRVCADASNRWHVHKWFLGYVRLSACHLALVYIILYYIILYYIILYIIFKDMYM